MSSSEKLQLLEAIWDDLSQAPEEIPVHDWQKDELSNRKAKLADAPNSGLTWDEVMRRVRSRYGR
jgi:putative addiction module component (TIGR02574 family)